MDKGGEDNTAWEVRTAGREGSEGRVDSEGVVWCGGWKGGSCLMPISTFSEANNILAHQSLTELSREEKRIQTERCSEQKLSLLLINCYKRTVP